MTFRFENGGGVALDLGMGVTWISIIVVFAIPVFIFWEARTRMFFLIFSSALIFLTIPVFYEFLTALYLLLIFSGFILISLALWKGFISKKMATGLFGAYISLGVAIFYFIFIGADETPAGVRPTTGEESLLGLYIFILVSIFALGFFLYQRYDIFELIEYFKKEEEETIESDISSTVEKAISDIYEGKDIESTILNCYKHMSLILEEEGVSDEEYMTPREFERAANETLEVPSSNISRIREIFELARYSSHKLMERDKQDVIKDLKALRDELI